jgi:hypothetical protein
MVTGGKSNWLCCQGDGAAATGAAATAAAGAAARCLVSDFEEDRIKYEASVWFTEGAGSATDVTGVEPLVHCCDTEEDCATALAAVAAAAPPPPRSSPISRLRFALAS